MPSILKRASVLLFSLFFSGAISAQQLHISIRLASAALSKLSPQMKCCIALPSGTPANFFGFTQTLVGGANNPTVATPTLRLWDTSGACEWSNIETSPGVYTFTNCDAFTDRANSVGANWSFAYGRTPCAIITTPASCAGTFAPNGGCQKPANLNTTNASLVNFTTALINHWKSRYPTVTGNFLEGPNEADLRNTWCNDAGTANGSMTDLVTYTTAVKTTAQALDPTIVMVCPSASTYNPFSTHLLGPPTGTTPTAGNGYLQTPGAAASCDVINVHPYSMCGVPVSCVTPDAAPASMAQLATLLSGFGITKPIVDSETNWGTSPANSTMTDDQRIQWIARFHIYAWDAGHRYVWFYQWNCASGNLPACYGTFSGSGVGASVATSYTTLQSWITGSQHVNLGCNQNADGQGTWYCPFVSASAHASAFIFNPTSSVAFTTSGFTTQFNLDGTSSAIVGNSVTAAGKPIMVQ